MCIQPSWSFRQIKTICHSAFAFLERHHKLRNITHYHLFNIFFHHNSGYGEEWVYDLGLTAFFLCRRWVGLKTICHEFPWCILICSHFSPPSSNVLPVSSLDESHAELVDEHLGRQPGESRPSKNQDLPSAKPLCDGWKGPAHVRGPVCGPACGPAPVCSSGPQGELCGSAYLLPCPHAPPRHRYCVNFHSCDTPHSMKNIWVIQICKDRVSLTVGCLNAVMYSFPSALRWCCTLDC